MTYEIETEDNHEHATASPTARVLDELALYGYRPGPHEPDPRPLPDGETACLQLDAAVEALSAIFTDTRLEIDHSEILWAFVSIFHRRCDRIAAELDANEQAQRKSQADQDGSEVQSVELERLIEEGLALIERRETFELLRDHAAELFESATGSAWRPRTGSMISHRRLTASLIDSRDFIAAERQAKTQMLAPKGTRIAFTGGMDCNDDKRIWSVLDKLHAQHPDMVLLHGGATKGADFIASRWCDHRKVPQVAFKPNFTRDKNRAGFLRNDRMLETLPAQVVVFPGTGVSLNLRDKAKKLGIPVLDFSKSASV
jgi:YspA, cpYpsA-related SLOG family